MRVALVTLQLVGGAALLAGGARPPLERLAQRGPRAAVVCGLFDAMGSATAWSTTAWSTRSLARLRPASHRSSLCARGRPPQAVALWCRPNVAETARLTLQVRLQRIRSACSVTTWRRCRTSASRRSATSCCAPIGRRWPSAPRASATSSSPSGRPSTATRTRTRTLTRTLTRTRTRTRIPTLTLTLTRPSSGTTSSALRAARASAPNASQGANPRPRPRPRPRPKPSLS